MRPFNLKDMLTVVGQGFPANLALGAAMGQPLSRIISRYVVFGQSYGDCFQVCGGSFGTMGFFLKTNVKGPGQKCSINSSAFGETCCTSLETSEASETCTMGGLSRGRFLAANNAETASAFRASAPKP